MILYKVVKFDRTSAYATQKEYKKVYRKNKIVHATEGTLGIFCFKERKYAEYFKATSQEIIRVKSIGRAKYPKTIGYTSHLNSYYQIEPRKRKFGICKCPVPKGTVCYPAVEVLE